MVRLLDCSKESVQVYSTERKLLRLPTYTLFVITPPNGLTKDEFILKLLMSQANFITNYQNNINVEYEALNQAPGEYNSNSYINSLLHHNGYNLPNNLQMFILEPTEIITYNPYTNEYVTSYIDWEWPGQKLIVPEIYFELYESEVPTPPIIVPGPPENPLIPVGNPIPPENPLTLLL